ncbi:unnamed protein product [Orchesella dallaii]|uniref:Uncharacterized protein n=1 Tax=Orchesella dallaii TaxID=48710 RepID=A0ABP1QGS8_9HEXA
MWFSKTSPGPLTAESLNIVDQRRLAQKQSVKPVSFREIKLLLFHKDLHLPRSLTSFNDCFEFFCIYRNQWVNQKNHVGRNHPDVHFRTDTTLPKYMRLFFNPDRMNIPLEDFDPFYAETTPIRPNQKIMRFITAQSDISVVHDTRGDSRLHSFGPIS